MCRPVTACELESAACYPDNASFPLHSFQLRDCGAPAAGGYEFAIGRSSIADPRPVTGATCLIVQVNGTLLVLTGRTRCVACFPSANDTNPNSTTRLALFFLKVIFLLLFFGRFLTAF